MRTTFNNDIHHFTQRCLHRKSINQSIKFYLYSPYSRKEPTIELELRWLDVSPPGQQREGRYHSVKAPPTGWALMLLPPAVPRSVQAVGPLLLINGTGRCVSQEGNNRDDGWGASMRRKQSNHLVWILRRNHQEKPSGETIRRNHQEKPSGETIRRNHQEKPSGETIRRNHREKPSGETIGRNHREKPSGETIRRNYQEKPSGETNRRNHREKPSGETIRRNHQEKPSGETIRRNHPHPRVREWKQLREPRESMLHKWIRAVWKEKYNHQGNRGLQDIRDHMWEFAWNLPSPDINSRKQHKTPDVPDNVPSVLQRSIYMSV